MITLPYNIVCGYYDSSELAHLAQSPKRKVIKYEIEFYLEDGLSTFADDKEYIIKKHAVQIAKPGQVRYSRLPFKTMFLKFSADGEIAERLMKAPEYFNSTHPERIIEKLDEIILLNESGGDALLLQSRLLSFLHVILFDSEIPQRQSGQNYEIIAKAKRYIESNYQKPIHLKDIASSVNLSHVYFHNVFVAACGITPHGYLTHYRIAEAKKQLCNSATSLSLIAENCGFGCQQYFSKIFKEQTGTTPAKYRREIQESYAENETTSPS